MRRSVYKQAQHLLVVVLVPAGSMSACVYAWMYVVVCACASEARRESLALDGHVGHSQSRSGAGS